MTDNVKNIDVEERDGEILLTLMGERGVLESFYMKRPVAERCVTDLRDLLDSLK